MPTSAQKNNKKKKNQDNYESQGSDNLEPALKKKSTYSKSINSDGISQGNVVSSKCQPKRTKRQQALDNEDNETLKRKLVEAQKWLAATEALLQAKSAGLDTTANSIVDISSIAIEDNDEVESEDEDDDAQLTPFRSLGEVPTRCDAVEKKKRRLYHKGDAPKLLSSRETTPDNHDSTSNSKSLRGSSDTNVEPPATSRSQTCA
ncbi:uncharacterized protein PHACADRAFT_32610 [Phanerochaete carnosa HHB-10118-sp]|uniref:Uncharacterized protein n=1 Tax=Phanerochaete carnosa (strain HHB-10118-sp) TaxID=650164 RepID=K5ULN8_PHACS|nr:uncharacterized protein PHACADRAFT_32610 [Phanerochaete carnosa HHB-10118-sp]EKM50596.1 hypothetical protein PHACADRAFT_32610 [Phanerochaete carnosa HHB-10118-sp]